MVVDTHCDTLLRILPPPGSGRKPIKLGERSDEGHIDLPRLRDGGVDCQVFAIYTGWRPNPPDALLRALQLIIAFERECDENEDLVKAESYGDIMRAVEGGRIAGLLSLEGAEPLMGDPEMIRVFHRLGVRMISLTWNWRNPFADGVAASRAESRLTDLGLEAIGEMERLGIILDVSHLSDSCFWDVAEVAGRPFIASHSNCRALCNHPRNLTDDMIRAIADHGGVVGINFAPDFIHKEKATLSRVVDHIDHVVEVAGIDHVGLGSDFDGIRSTPEGLEDVSRLPGITEELLRRGYSEGEIRKILGGNHLRVFREVIG
ncbi:membrane dipeptidase [Candidatus Bathyarchaeota archaeon]|nr:MAG: membrane dipeptidase [Candidatus Bathyarchaeota archaeon]